QAPHQPGQPGFKFTVAESCDRIKDEFQFLQAQYHSLKVEYDKLANEKTEMQRHYVMYYEMSTASTSRCINRLLSAWRLLEGGKHAASLVVAGSRSFLEAGGSFSKAGGWILFPADPLVLRLLCVFAAAAAPGAAPLPRRPRPPGAAAPPPVGPAAAGPAPCDGRRLRAAGAGRSGQPGPPACKRREEPPRPGAPRTRVQHGTCTLPLTVTFPSQTGHTHTHSHTHSLSCPLLRPGCVRSAGSVSVSSWTSPLVSPHPSDAETCTCLTRSPGTCARGQLEVAGWDPGRRADVSDC
ncbi:unnamed protein product, partial [Tetraodon nigroviridis]